MSLVIYVIAGGGDCACNADACTTLGYTGKHTGTDRTVIDVNQCIRQWMECYCEMESSRIGSSIDRIEWAIGSVTPKWAVTSGWSPVGKVISLLLWSALGTLPMVHQQAQPWLANRSSSSTLSVHSRAGQQQLQQSEALSWWHYQLLTAY